MQRDLFDSWAEKYRQRLNKEDNTDKQRAIKMKDMQGIPHNGHKKYLLAAHHRI